MLLQMPIWFALYRVLWASIELRQAPLFGWIQDLSAADPYKVLPILLGATMWLQQKMMPQTGADPAQAKIMLWTMPILFTFIMLNLPAGLVLYIFVNTILSVGQTMYINRTLPSAEMAKA